MSFSILTNNTSLQAQQYLNANQAFQSKTIQQVTSGLRIVNSGDDAAGLAIANGYRSTEAVLKQGVLNANDGLSQLQIVDGGINNISQLLDRASTLATQSASGTFTGNRGVLDSEFQSVVGEINREAQSIGLTRGGSLAQNLQVFIGGGQSNGGITAINNGSVGVDLSKSAVDAQSLGLTGVQAIGVKGTDIGSGSANTSLSAILGNASNSSSTGTAGFTSFVLKGPGFAGNGVAISVNTANLGGTSDLVAAVNAAIQGAANGGTQAATALKNANISASINTDSTGKQQLVFSSSTSAFQVQAGDREANALLGNFAQNAVATGTDNNPTVDTSTNTALTLAVDGGSAFTVNVTSGAATSKGQIASDLNSYFTSHSIGATASLNGNQLAISSTNGGASSAVTFTGTALSAALGLSSASAATASTGAAVSASVQGGSAVAAGANLIGTDSAATATVAAADTFIVSVGNSGAQTLTLANAGTQTKAEIAADINTQIAANTHFTAANQAQVAASVVNNQIVFTATTPGSAITLGAGTVNAALGFSTAQTSTAHTATTSDTIHLRFQGSGLTSPVDISLTPTVAGTTTSANVLTNLQSQVAGNSALQAAGITLSTAALGNNLVFTSSKGEQFQVSSTGDSQNLLGLGSFQTNTSSGNTVDYTTITAGSAYSTGVAGGAGPAQLEVSLNGLASSGNQISVALNGAGTDAVAAQVAGTVSDSGGGSASAAVQTGTTAQAVVTAATSGVQTGTVAATAGNFDLSLNGAGASANLDLVVNGNAVSVTLGNSNTNTTASVIGAINTAIGANGTASIDGGGHLVITSATTGGTSTVQVAGTSDAGLLTDLGLTASTGTGAAAVNGFNLSAAAGGAALNLVVNGTAVSATLGNSATTSSASILTAINTAIGAHGTASINGSGHLVITSATTGLASTVQVAGTSDANLLTALGLTASTQTGSAAGGINLSGAAGAGAQLKLQVDGTHSINVTLGNASSVSAISIAGSINTALGALGTASVDGTGHIVLKSASTGAASSVQVLATSDAGLTTALGYTPGATARGTNATEANVINQINTAIAGNSSLTKAGLQATNNAGSIQLVSNNNTYFRVNSFGAGNIGFGNAGASFTGNTQSAAPATSQYFDSQGASATTSLAYTDTLYGSDNQTIAVTGSDAAGAKHSIGITLENNTTARQQTIDQAIGQINTQLQQSNDSTLQSIVAVKDTSNGVQSIRFLSTLNNFQVSVGADAGGTGVTPPSGNVANSTTLGTGLTASVGTQSNAEAAVGALANAITLLGNSQAVVGRGENQFNYAVNLAQSQLTNTSAAESGIRDADLASAAANLTKAQILVQAGVAALAQANSAPQQILSLLKG